MKMIRRISSSIIVLAMIILLSNTAWAQETQFEYKITVESENWFDYSVKEKNAMLRIDEETLEVMTDEQLVQAIADYPYLIDIYVCGTLEEGLKVFEQNCDAYAELMSRETGIESYLIYSKKLIVGYNENPRPDGRTEFVINALEDIAQYFENVFCEEVNDMTLVTAISPPKTGVVYLTPSENHATSYHTAQDNEAVNTYGVVLVRNGSCKYNCHSYAWHSTSSSNIYWIDNPSLYMTDGSHTRKYSGGVSTSTALCNASLNDKVYYASNTHSALFKDNPSSGVPLSTAMVQSKWGTLGVFKHRVSNVPASYNDSSVSIWH